MDASRSNEYIPFTMPALLQKVLPVMRPVVLSAPAIALAARAIATKGM